MTNDEIYRTINKLFGRYTATSTTRKQIDELIASGKITQTDIFRYAQSVGTDLSTAFVKTLTAENMGSEFIFRELAETIIDPMFRSAHGKINDKAIEMQKVIDAAENIGINPVAGEYSADRALGLVEALCADGISPEKQIELMKEPVITNCLKYFDEFIYANADVRSDMGFSAKIIRTPARACCKWCQNLAGVYDYEDVKNTGNDVFRRHQNCPCTVTFKTDRIAQNVWNKRNLWERNR